MSFLCESITVIEDRDTICHKKQQDTAAQSDLGLCCFAIWLKLSHLSAHLVNHLLRENRKSIPKFLKGKKLGV